jgi:hypothetical protein
MSEITIGAIAAVMSKEYGRLRIWP